MTNSEAVKELYLKILGNFRGFDVAPKFTSLLYGTFGSAKTVSTMRIAQLVTPADKRILHVDTSEGYVSLNNHPELKERVQPFQSDLTISQIITICEYIRQGAPRFSDFGTIVIDEVNPLVREKILETGKIRERRQIQKGDLKLDEDALDQRDYGIAQNKLAPLWKALLSLKDVNVLLCAHERTGEENGISVKMADFPQAIRKDIIRFSHIVGRTTATTDREGNYQRKIQVLPTRTVEARTRVGGLQVENTIEEVLDAIQKWMNSDAVNKTPDFKGYEIP